MLEDKIEKLVAKIDENHANGEMSNYMRDMWKYVVANIEKPDLEVKQYDWCDAVPYIPHEVNDWISGLTSESEMLDVGCLGGYGMFDFAERRRSSGLSVPRMTGVDIDVQSVEIGRKLAPIWSDDGSVAFQVASIGKLPCDDNSMDLVVAKLVLPCVHVEDAMKEMARVLRVGGLLFIQYHTYDYYLHSLFRRDGNFKRKIFCLRAILTGMLYSVFRFQPRHKLFSDMPLTCRSMARLSKKYGMSELWSGGYKAKPLELLGKK